MGAGISRAYAGAHRWTELIPDPTLLCDAEGIILRANSHAQAFFGVAESQLSGVPVLWVIPTDSRERFLSNWNRRALPMCPCDPETSPLTIRNSNGRAVAIWMTINEIKSVGRPYAILVFKDISTSDGRDALDEARLSEHMSLVRHKLRSPLSGITVFAEVLLRNKRGNLDATQIDQLTAIRNAAGNLASLITDIEVPGAVPVDRTA